MCELESLVFMGKTESEVQNTYTGQHLLDSLLLLLQLTPAQPKSISTKLLTAARDKKACLEKKRPWFVAEELKGALQHGLTAVEEDATQRCVFLDT